MHLTFKLKISMALSKPKSEKMLYYLTNQYKTTIEG